MRILNRKIKVSFYSHLQENIKDDDYFYCGLGAVLSCYCGSCEIQIDFLFWLICIDIKC